MKANYSKLWDKIKSKKLSIHEFCVINKISSQTLKQMNAGKNISLPILQKICSFFGCEPKDIITFTKDEKEINKTRSSHNSKPTVVSLFSGAGGMDLGFIQAGFNVVWANDFFKEAIDTYKNNIGKHIVYGDIRMIPSEEIPNNPDIIVGGFPCQGFSIANLNRNMGDWRNFLYKEMLRVIKDKQPKMFIAENVKGLASMEKGKILKMILADFSDLGYHVEYKILNAAEYGVPQTRERIIIIGTRISNFINFPKKTHYLPGAKQVKGLKPAITCAEAIGWLKNIPCSKEPIKLKNGEYVYQHWASTNVADKFFTRKYEIDQFELCDYLNYWRKKANLTVKEIEKMFGYKYTAGHWFRKDNNCGSIPKPEDWLKLKQILQFDNKFDDKVLTFVKKDISFGQSLRVSNWNTPSDTITASGPEIHINKERRLSVRECALIQTFPKDFIFSGKTIGVMYKQIGNAVPVLLAKKIAQCIKCQLKNSD